MENSKTHNTMTFPIIICGSKKKLKYDGPYLGPITLLQILNKLLKILTLKEHK